MLRTTFQLSLLLRATFQTLCLWDGYHCNRLLFVMNLYAWRTQPVQEVATQRTKHHSSCNIIVAISFCLQYVFSIQSFQHKLRPEIMCAAETIYDCGVLYDCFGRKLSDANNHVGRKHTRLRNHMIVPSFGHKRRRKDVLKIKVNTGYRESCAMTHTEKDSNHGRNTNGNHWRGHIQKVK